MVNQSSGIISLTDLKELATKEYSKSELQIDDECEIWLFRLPKDLTAQDLEGVKLEVDNSKAEGECEKAFTNEDEQTQFTIKYSISSKEADSKEKDTVLPLTADSSKKNFRTVGQIKRQINVTRVVNWPNKTHALPQPFEGAPYGHPEDLTPVYFPFGSVHKQKQPKTLEVEDAAPSQPSPSKKKQKTMK